MPLQCDPTVIYALMRAGRWHGNLTRSDLQIDSPYNTYRYPGLPPGPIASPGRASLEAALHPADVPYLYFVSRNDGTHAFATTLAEHNRNVAQVAGAVLRTAVAIRAASDRTWRRVRPAQSRVSPLELFAQHVEVRARRRVQQAEQAPARDDVRRRRRPPAARRTGRRT